MENEVEQIYNHEVLPNLNWLAIFSSKNPKDSINSVGIDCPRCSKHEAVVFKNTGAIKCNRQSPQY